MAALREFRIGSARVTAACAPSAAELHRGVGGEADLTGHVPWLACVPLCEFLASEAGCALLAGRPRVLELGAGVGLPGLLAGRAASELRLTDNQPAIVAQLAASLRANAALGLVPAASSADLLEWGAEAQLLPHVCPGGYDLLLASDCVYYAGSAHLLVQTAARLLAPAGLLLLSYTARWDETDRALALALRAAGMNCRLATSAGSGAGDGREREHGRSGRVARVYAVRRAVPRGASAAALAELVESLSAAGLSASLDGGAPGASLVVDGVGPLCLGPAELGELRAALRAEGGGFALRSLRLRGHWLEAEGAEEAEGGPVPCGLASLLRLRCCASLAALDLGGNLLGGGAGAGAAGAAEGGGVLRGLCAALRSCGRLASLRLSAARLADADAVLLARCLLDRARLSPAGADAAATSEGLAAPAAAPACAPLRELDVSDNAIGSDGLVALVRALAAACAAGDGVRSLALELSHNGLEQEGAAALSAALPPCLTQLSVGRQWLGDEGGAQLGGVGLAACARCLTSLDLSFATTGWGALAALRPLLEEPPPGARDAAPPGCALLELRLRGCSLRDCGAAALAAALRRGALPALRGLGLGTNAIGWEGAEAIAEALAPSSDAGGCGSWCACLAWLGLDDNPLGCAGVDAIADALQLRADAASAAPGSDGASEGRAAVASRCYCPPLRRLGLSAVGCGDEGLEALCAALAAIPAAGAAEPGAGAARGLELDLQANPISAAGAAAALARLRGCALALTVDLRHAPAPDAAGARGDAAATAAERTARDRCRALREELRGTPRDQRQPAHAAASLGAASPLGSGAGGWLPRVVVHLAAAHGGGGGGARGELTSDEEEGAGSILAAAGY